MVQRQLRLLVQAEPVGRHASRRTAAEDDHPQPVRGDPDGRRRDPDRDVIRPCEATSLSITSRPASFIFYATPAFFLGLVIIVVFSHLGWFPPEAPQGGVICDFTDLGAIILPVRDPRAAEHCGVLPVHALLGARQHQPGLRAHGPRKRRARRRVCDGTSSQRADSDRHPARPVAPRLFAGALITESVFNFPGMGLLFYQAAQAGLPACSASYL